MAYLALSSSVALGVLLIGSVGFAVLIVRKIRGTQTRLEQQAFKRAGQYRESAGRVYEEGKHRVARYGRRSERLDGWFTHVTFALGGEGGSSLLKDLGSRVSPETPCLNISVRRGFGSTERPRY